MNTPLRHNDLLSILPAADLHQLLGDLEWVDVAAGATLHEPGTPLTQVHFPVSAVVALSLGLKDGAAAELALVGREGVVGIGAFMGQGRSIGHAVVQTAGTCWRVSASSLDAAARAEPRLMQALLRYAHALIQQMAQLAACGRHHALQARLCRWLLAHLDRSPGSELMATHDQMAQGLGVRREGVTVVAQKLSRAGTIRYSRGHIHVLDRAALEALSCECYTAVSEGLARARRANVLLQPPAAPARDTDCAQRSRSALGALQLAWG